MKKSDVDVLIREIETGQTPQWVTDHLRAYRESGGREGHLWDTSWAGGKGPTPCLILTTVGRRSGEKRASPLIYGTAGQDYVVIGSKGGSATHAGWYWNLVAHPEVELEVGTERFRARARVAEGEERKRLWAQMAEIYPPYEEYQAKTSREIPVIVLERK